MTQTLLAVDLRAIPAANRLPEDIVTDLAEVIVFIRKALNEGSEVILVLQVL